MFELKQELSSLKAERERTKERVCTLYAIVRTVRNSSSNTISVLFCILPSKDSVLLSWRRREYQYRMNYMHKSLHYRSERYFRLLFVFKSEVCAHPPCSYICLV